MNPALQFPQIASKIIKGQELIIGPLAWYEAQKIEGIQIVNKETGEVAIQSLDPKSVINKLVAQYEKIFGAASHTVCQEAAKEITDQLLPEDVPTSLK